MKVELQRHTKGHKEKRCRVWRTGLPVPNILLKKLSMNFLEFEGFPTWVETDFLQWYRIDDIYHGTNETIHLRKPSRWPAGPS
jgi:hypothetical protein